MDGAKRNSENSHSNKVNTIENKITMGWDGMGWDAMVKLQY